jgi:rubrerythrin
MDDTQVKAPGSEQGKVIVPKEGSALRRLAEDDSSRKRFLKMVGGAGAAGAFTLLLAACGDDDEETEGAGDTTAPDERAAQGDLDILNYALTLEYLEATFYEAVVNSDIKPPSQEVAQIVESILANEQEHVDALTATIEQMGGTPAEAPQANFEAVLKGGANKVLATAARVENVGAAAYLFEAPDIQSEDVLAAALSIHTVEARHAAAINGLAGLDFTGSDQFEGTIPDGAFASGADRDTVMKEIEPFLTGGGN